MDKWQEAQKQATPFLDLEELKISSNCSEKTLSFLLCQCINVKEIYMGMMTCVSDQVWSDVLAKNSLCYLEHLKILKSSKVSNLSKYSKVVLDVFLSKTKITIFLCIIANKQNITRRE